jgi:hypothetical protein
VGAEESPKKKIEVKVEVKAEVKDKEDEIEKWKF